MLKEFVKPLVTVKGVLINIPNDFTWYTTMMKVGISILNESHGLKRFTIKVKIFCTDCKEDFTVLVKKNEQPICPQCLS